MSEMETTMQLGTAAQWRAWIQRGWPLWGSLILVGVFPIWWKLGTGTEESLRHIGWLYEVVGVLSVLAELVTVMHKHGVDWPPVRLMNYLKQAPPFVLPPVLGKSDITLGAIGVSSSAAVGDLTTSPPTTSQRVATLEAEAKKLKEVVAKMDRRLDEVEASRAAKASEQDAKIERVSTKVDVEIKGIETQGLKLSLFGLLWLFLGMMLTTGTHEACQWVVPGCVEKAPISDTARAFTSRRHLIPTLPSWSPVMTRVSTAER